MKNTWGSLSFGLALLMVVSCSSLDSRSQKLQLGMSKAQATSLLGKKFKTVAARKEASGSQIEIIQYESKRGQPLTLFFRDGNLVQWGDLNKLQAAPQ